MTNAVRDNIQNITTTFVQQNVPFLITQLQSGPTLLLKCSLIIHNSSTIISLQFKINILILHRPI